MSETLYITTQQNQNSASASASQTGGLVLVIGSTSISNGLEICELWSATPLIWVQNVQSRFTSYSEVIYTLSHTKIFYHNPFISSRSLVVDFSTANITKNYLEINDVVNIVAEALSESKNFTTRIY